MINPSEPEGWPNRANEPKPIDIASELISIKARLETLEQRLYTINLDRRLGPQPDKTYSTEELDKVIQQVRRMNV